MTASAAAQPSRDPHAAPSGAPTSWDGDGEVPAAPTPRSDPQRLDATGIAETAMRAFARPREPEASWWADFRAFLTPQAVADYAGTDPANVPARRVTGPGRVIPTDSDVLTRIQVPTDAGSYLVLLTRSPEFPDWRVDRLLPPERRVGD